MSRGSRTKPAGSLRPRCSGDGPRSRRRRRLGARAARCVAAAMLARQVGGDRGGIAWRRIASSSGALVVASGCRSRCWRWRASMRRRWLRLAGAQRQPSRVDPGRLRRGGGSNRASSPATAARPQERELVAAGASCPPPRSAPPGAVVAAAVSAQALRPVGPDLDADPNPVNATVMSFRRPPLHAAMWSALRTGFIRGWLRGFARRCPPRGAGLNCCT
jgi:hypothetical protein